MGPYSWETYITLLIEQFLSLRPIQFSSDFDQTGINYMVSGPNNGMYIFDESSIFLRVAELSNLKIGPYESETDKIILIGH
jgi:hypothetical protein